jgi:DNA-directed RNA polymerase specialized sigma subunit
MAKKSNHYVNNKDLLAAMTKYREGVQAALASETQKPPIPDYVGECLLLIANRLSRKPNFVNYSYREEMISDGIENCINYIDNFDPEKSQNPFAYFTQIIYYAFLRRIQKEKKQLYIKHKALEDGYLMDVLQGDGDESPLKISVDNQSDYMIDFVETFESNIEKRKQARRKGVELFFDEE